MVRSFVVLVWVLLLALPAPLPAAARPADPASPTIVRHAPAAGAIDCDDLWSSGFPVKGLGLSDCLEHSNETIGSAEYRVVYPADWASTPGWGTTFLEPARQAIRDSVAVYGKLGDMLSITLVFSPQLLPIDPLHPLSVVPAGTTQLVGGSFEEPCAIVLYPKVVYAEAQFKQTVAHEVFHCFQDWNLAAQVIGSGNWWIEGSATYFGNVVYPTANKEWLLIEPFDAGSATVRLTASSYAACFFFQFLGNVIGNEAIIRLLATMPTGGGEGEQQAALRAWPGMESLFQEFAQGYLDGTILDTSGAAIPFSPDVGAPVVLSKAGNVDTKVEPFVIGRRLFTGNTEVSVTAAADESASTALYGFRQDAGSWTTAAFELDCHDPQIVLAAITTVGTSAGTLRLEVTTGEPCSEPTPDADSCLIGAWQVRDYEAFMVAALGLAGADASAVPVTFDGASGSMTFTFDPSTITYTATEFELRGSAVTQGIVIEVVIRISGTATAGYEVSEKGVIDIIEVDASGFTITAETFVGGSPAGVMPMDALDWIFFASDTYGYTCSKTSLQLTIPPLAVPVVLQR